MAKFSARAAALKHGWRSGLEQDVAQSLIDREYKYRYEKLKLTWIKPETRHTYTPDFEVQTASGKVIIIETKGRWLTADRHKMKFVLEQNPDYDIRMVFQRSAQKISPGSPTTYGDWATKLGMKFADKDIPIEWLLE